MIYVHGEYCGEKEQQLGLWLCRVSSLQHDDRGTSSKVNQQRKQHSTKQYTDTRTLSLLYPFIQCVLLPCCCMSCVCCFLLLVLFFFLYFYLCLSSCSFYKRIISADALSAISTICGVALLRSAGVYKVIMA